MTPENYTRLVGNVSDTEIVARTAWGEARGEGPNGMQAVINVISNRVDHPSWWGFNWRGVCLARSQFSCWDEDDPNFPKLLALTVADPQYVTCMSLADSAMSGNLPDITRGADSYQVIGTNAYWSKGLTPVITIGKHEFFITRKT